MIAEHCNNRYTQAHEGSQHRLHLFGFTEIGNVAGQDQKIRFVAQATHGIADAVITLRGKMKIGYSGDSHGFLLSMRLFHCGR